MKRVLRRLRGKRAISLLETVIAFLLISIITGSAISVVSYSTQVYNDTLDRFDSRVKADNALSAFQFAETRNEFREALTSAGFAVGEDNDFIASSYFFKSLKISRENQNVVFQDAEDHAIYTMADYTDAQITALLAQYDDPSAMPKFEKGVDYYNCASGGDQKNIYKAKVDFQNGAVMFYMSDSVGWLYYRDGRFYHDNGNNSWSYYTINSGNDHTMWSGPTACSTVPTANYRTEADAAGKEVGNPDGTQTQRIAYLQAYDTYLIGKREAMFSALRSANSRSENRYTFSENSKSYSTYEYASPYLETVEVYHNANGSNTINFCDADGLAILSRTYADNDDDHALFLKTLRWLNQSGYKESTGNQYDFSIRYDNTYHVHTYTCTVYFYKSSTTYYSVDFSRHDCGYDFDDREYKYTVTACNGDTTLYCDASNDRTWGMQISGWRTYQPDGVKDSDFWSLTSKVRQSTRDVTVTANSDTRTISFTDDTTTCYFSLNSKGKPVWSTTNPNYTAEQYETALTAFKNCSYFTRSDGHEEDYIAGEKSDGDVITVSVNNGYKTVSCSDTTAVIVPDQKTFATAKETEDYLAARPGWSTYTQISEKDTLEWETNYTAYTESGTAPVISYSYTTRIPTSNNSPVTVVNSNGTYTVTRCDSGTSLKYLYWSSGGCSGSSWEWDSSQKTISSSNYTGHNATEQFPEAEYTVTFHNTNRTITTKKGNTTFYFNGSQWVRNNPNLSTTQYQSAVTTVSGRYTLEDYTVLSGGEKTYTPSDTPYTATITAEFTDGQGTISYEIPVSDGHGGVNNVTKYFNQNGVSVNAPPSITTLEEFQAAVAKVATKCSASVQKEEASFTVTIVALSAHYEDNSFHFYNDDDVEMYCEAYDNASVFKDAQVALYDKSYLFLDNHRPYLFTLVRYLGRVEVDDANRTLHFKDDIGTDIISFPYTEDADGVARYAAAKQRLSDSEYFTYHADTCTVIMKDPNTPILIDRTNKTMTYSEQWKFLFMSGTNTYYYKGSGTDWSKSNPNFASEQAFNNALTALRENYGKTVLLDQTERTITFRHQGKLYYYTGQGTDWKTNPVIFPDAAAYNTAKSTLQSTYGEGYFSALPYYLYYTPKYSVHIHLGQNRENPQNPIYYITLYDTALPQLDEWEGIFYERYSTPAERQEYEAIVEAYKSTYLISNDEYTCYIGNYEVTISASFRSLDFSAVVENTNTGKEAYQLNYTKG